MSVLITSILIYLEYFQSYYRNHWLMYDSSLSRLVYVSIRQDNVLTNWAIGFKRKINDILRAHRCEQNWSVYRLIKITIYPSVLQSVFFLFKSKFQNFLVVNKGCGHSPFDVDTSSSKQTHLYSQDESQSSFCFRSCCLILHKAHHLKHLFFSRW